MKSQIASLVYLITLFYRETVGFSSVTSHVIAHKQLQSQLEVQVRKNEVTKLQMSYYDNNNNRRNDFDLSKPTFDLFSLRTIRNDALLQYSSLNQSEPLRINLYLILTITLFSFPTISEAVIGEQANIQSTIISVVTGIASFSLFIKECRNRLNQLIRIEKEMNAEYLKLSLSTRNKLNPKLFDNDSGGTSLKSFRGNKRVVVICGTTNELKDVMLSFRIFRRRLTQANSIVVPIPTDVEKYNNNMKEWWNQLGVTETEIRSCQWLAQPQDLPSWIKYFENLLEENNSKDEKITRTQELVWFGLNYNGRSFASGSGINNSPILLQILGQNLRPTEILDECDEDESIVAGSKDVDVDIIKTIQSTQKQFYQALTEGDMEAMESIFSSTESNEVTEVRSVKKYGYCVQDR